MTVNTTKNIIFTATDKEINKMAHQAITAVNDLTLKAAKQNDVDITKITHRYNKVYAFTVFFGKEANLDQIEITKEMINYWLEVANTTKTNNDFDIKKICLYGKHSNCREPIKSYWLGIKAGIRRVLIYLSKEQALILPYKFLLPNLITELNLLNNEEYHSIYNEILIKIRGLHLDSGMNLRVPGSMMTSRKLNTFAGIWQKVILTTDWKNSDDINLNDLLTIHVESNKTRHGLSGYSTSSIAVQTLGRFLIQQYGTKVNFTENELEKSIQEVNISTHISRLEAVNGNTNNIKKAGYSSVLTLEQIDRCSKYVNERNTLKAMRINHGKIYDLMNMESNSTETELISSLSRFKYSVLTQEKFLEYLVNETTLLTKRGEKCYKIYLNLFDHYLKKRKLESENAPRTAFGMFIVYNIFYLEWWFKNNKNPDVQFPGNPKKLAGPVFISRPIALDGALPDDYISLFHKIADNSSWSGNTAYAYLKQLEKFFLWIESASELREDCKGFKCGIGEYDFPNTYRSSITNKIPLPRRLFNPLMSYLYALEDIQTELSKKVMSGEIHCSEFSKSGQIIKLSDFNIVAEFDFHGNIIKINEIPRFFFLEVLTTNRNSVTVTDNVISTAELRICILMLETGIRGNHIKWLDLLTYDKLIPFNSDSNLEELYVNTDKVKKNAWISVVSRRVIELCNKQKAWRAQILNDSFCDSQHYNNNNKTAYDSFLPLFSSRSNGSVRTSGYTATWDKVLISFEDIYKKNNLDTYKMYGYKPTDRKTHYGQYIPRTPIPKEKDLPINWKINDGPHTKITIGVRHTPHAARVTVVSNDITVLPAKIIGKYRTGQSEAVVFYYAVVDDDVHNSTQKAQWDEVDSTIPTPFLSDDTAEHLISSVTDMNSRLAASIANNPIKAIDSYGLMTLDITSKEHDNKGKTSDDCNKDGLSIIRNKTSQSLAFNTTHICPFNNICPKEIVEKFNRLSPCSVCPYAIKGIEHIRAISAASARSKELLLDCKMRLKHLLKSGGDSEDIASLEREIDWFSMESIGWEYAEYKLYTKAKEISDEDNNNDGLICDVDEPKFVSQRLQQFKIGNENSPEYLIKRLEDCKAFPSLDSPSIRAKFDIARRRMLAMIGRNDEAWSLTPSANPSTELYSLIKSYMNTYELSPAQVIGLLRISPQEMIDSLPNPKTFIQIGEKS